MHHVITGAGSPPIVFVHGFACSHTDWRAQVRHFSARHKTVAVDLPGHSATPAPTGPASIELCGSAVAELLRSLTLPPAVLAGHSMGCRVVLDAAIKAPERVAGVVLVDGSRFAAEAAEAFEARFAGGEYAAVIGGMFEQMFTPASNSVAKEAVMHRAAALPERVGRALLLSMVRFDQDALAAALRGLQRPLLVLQTTFLNAQRLRTSMSAGQTTPWLQFVRANAPGALIQVLPGVGHFPQIDAPAETNQILASFIASFGPAQTTRPAGEAR
jgi:pimeloyl-ACP methyl ester carboxylesterase